MEEVAATLTTVNDGVQDVLDISKDMNDQERQGAVLKRVELDNSTLF